MNAKRQQAEELIYKVLEKAEHGTINSDYYKQLFNNMTDEEFIEFFKRRLPIRFHVEAFKVEPKLNDIVDAFNILNVPLLEKVRIF